jgi:hypothetical protein
MGETTKYERLSRPHFGLNGTASLWLGTDHLLQVSNSMGSEHYRRWFFADLQAFIVRRNATRLIWNIVVGIVGLLVSFGALLVFAASANTTADRVGLNIVAAVLGFIALGFLAVALVNTLLGPTCTLYVQTPHGMEKLSAPGRLAVIERIIERVRPLVERMQSENGTIGLRETAAAFDEAEGS